MGVMANELDKRSLNIQVVMTTRMTGTRNLRMKPTNRRRRRRQL